MSEKRFKLSEIYSNQIIDTGNCVNNGTHCRLYDLKECVDLLNEQQELIEELHISDHMGWGRAEKFEKELKQKKIYIKRLEYKVQKFKEMNGEQQATIQSLQTELELVSGAKLFSRRELERKVKEQEATIRKLQDLCGESDYENAKLRQEIKELKAQLREKEEDERLYANEIVKLNKEAKEVLDFKSLGGDY